MTLLAVNLPCTCPHATIWLRELRGAEAQLVEGSHTAAAVRLLDRLIVAQAGAAKGPGEAATLTTADRDQVLAALCSATFGDRVEATRICDRCSDRFELEFGLLDLASSILVDLRRPPEDGVHVTAQGARFRLPAGTDELAIAGLPPEHRASALLERCLVEGDSERDRDAVLAAMQREGPTLDVDLQAACSSCAQPHQVAFSVQAWLLGHLMRDRDQLPRQIHLLARAYGWSIEDILSLPRHQRLALVDLVDEERRTVARTLSA